MPKINYLKFSQNIKSQYPEYKDWNDLELAEYFVAQEPRYSQSVDFGDLKKKDQAAPSLGEQGGLPSQQPSAQPRKAREERFFGGTFGDLLDALDMPTPGVPGSGLGIGDFIDDMGRAFSSGKKAGVNISTSRPLFFSGPGSSDEEVQNFVKAGTEYTGPSDEATQFYKDYEDSGKTTFGFVKALAKNPGIAPELVVQSASQFLFNPEARAAFGASIAAGAGIGALASAPLGGIGAAPGAIAAILPGVAAANTAVSTLSSFSELMKQELDQRGLEFNEDNVRTILEDEKALRKIRAKSAGYGITIGAFDLATAKVGGAIAAKIPMTTRAGKIKSTLATTGAEAVGGSAGEAAARGVTGQELDPAEIGLEGIAEIPGAAPTLLSQVLKRPTYKINGEFVGQADVDDILQNSSRQELENTKFEVFNDVNMYGSKFRNRLEDLGLLEEIIEANPNASEADINRLFELNSKLKKVENLNSESAKASADWLRSQIREVQDGLLTQEFAPQEVQQVEEAAPEAPQMAPTEASPEVGMEIPQEDQGVLQVINSVIQPISSDLEARMNNAEEIPMSEIEAVVDALIDAQQSVRSQDGARTRPTQGGFVTEFGALSDQQKRNLDTLIEQQINKLLNYEFATITTTEQAGEKTKTAGLVATPREGRPLPESVVSRDRFDGAGVRVGGRGAGRITVKRIPGFGGRSVYGVSFGNRKGVAPVEDLEFDNLEFVAPEILADGSFNARVKDSKSGLEFTITDPELSIDLAIAAQLKEAGRKEFPQPAFLEAVREVTQGQPTQVTTFPNLGRTGTTPAAVGVEPQTEQDVRQETNAPQEGRAQGENAAPVPQEEGRQEGQVTPPDVAQEGETPPAAKRTRKTEQQKADEGKAILDKLKETLRALKAKPGGGANIDLTFGVVPISKAVWNTAIDTAILAIDAGQSIAQAVKDASDYISSKIDGDWGKAKFEQYLGAKFADSGLTKEEASIPQEGDISVKDVKVVKGEDFKFDAEWEVRLGDRVIGRLWYDRSIQFWMNTDTMFGPGTATNPFKGILGSTKEEAIEKLVDDYNKSEKAKETKKEVQEVEERNFSNDKVLNRFLNRLSSLGGLEIPFFGDGFVYNGKALVEFDRFDKGGRNEVALRSIMAIDDTGKGVGSEVMSDITSAADELGTKLTLYASPFGTKAMSPSKLVSFYKKFGFTIDLNEAFGGDFSSEKSLLEYLDENPGEGVDMVREPKAKPESKPQQQAKTEAQGQVGGTAKERRDKFFDEIEGMYRAFPFQPGFIVSETPNKNVPLKDVKILGRLSVYEGSNDGSLYIDEVQAQNFGERTGNGSKIMQIVSDMADKYGLTIELVASPISGNNMTGVGKAIAKALNTPEKLAKFYEKFGFVNVADNLGREEYSRITKELRSAGFSTVNPVIPPSRQLLMVRPPKAQQQAQPEAQVEATAKALEGLASDKFRLGSSEETPTAINVDYGDISWPQSGLSSFNEGSDGKTYATDKNGDIYQVSKTKLSANKTFLVTIKNTNGEEVGSFEFKRNSDGSFSAEEAYTSKKGVGIATIAYDLASKDGEIIRPSKKLKKDGVQFWAKSISNAYHKAKADGSNPELVQAVEDLLGQTAPEAKPAKTIAEQRKEFRETAKKYFDGLKKMGIAFDPERNSKEDIAFLKALAKYIKLELDAGMVTFKGFLEKTANLIEGFNEKTVVAAAKEAWAKEVVKAYPKLYAKYNAAKRKELEREIKDIRKTMIRRIMDMTDPKIVNFKSQLKTEKRRLSKEAAAQLAAIRNAYDVKTMMAMEPQDLMELLNLTEGIYKEGRSEIKALNESLDEAAQIQGEEMLAAIASKDKRLEKLDSKEAASKMLAKKAGVVVAVKGDDRVIMKEEKDLEALDGEGYTFLFLNTTSDKFVDRSFLDSVVSFFSGKLRTINENARDLRTALELIKSKSKESQDFINGLVAKMNKASVTKARKSEEWSSILKAARTKAFGPDIKFGYTNWMNAIAKVNGKPLNLTNGRGVSIGPINNGKIISLYRQLMDPTNLVKTDGVRKIDLSDESIQSIIDYMNLPANRPGKSFALSLTDFFRKVAKDTKAVLENNGYNSTKLDEKRYNAEDFEGDEFIAQVMGQFADTRTEGFIPYTPIQATESPDTAQGVEIKEDDLFDSGDLQKNFSVISNNMITRRPGGLIVPTDIRQTLNAYPAGMANMSAKLPLLRETQSIFSKRNLTAMSNAFAPQFTENLKANYISFMTDRVTPVISNKTEAAMKTWLMTSTAIPMFLNPKTGLLQLLGSPNFIVSYDLSKYIDASKKLLSDGALFKETILEIINLPIMKQRYGGRFSPDSRVISEEMSRYGKVAINIPFTNLKISAKELLSKGYIFSSIGDVFAIALGGAPIYYDIVQTNKKKYIAEGMSVFEAETKAKQDAEEKLFEIIQETQQSSEAMYLSEFQKQSITRIFSSFATSTMQYYRKARRAAARMKNKEGNQLQNAYEILHYTAINAAVFQFFSSMFVDWLSGPGEDELEEMSREERMDFVRYMEDVMATVAQGTGGLGVALQALILAYKESEKSGKPEKIVESALRTVPAVRMKYDAAINTIREWKRGDYVRSLTRGAELANIPADRIRSLGLQVSDALMENLDAQERIARLMGFRTESWMREKKQGEIWNGVQSAVDKSTPPERQRAISNTKSAYRDLFQLYGKRYAEATTEAEKARVDSIASKELLNVYNHRQGGPELAEELQKLFNQSAEFNSLPKDMQKLKNMETNRKIGDVVEEVLSLEKKSEQKAMEYWSSLVNNGIISDKEIERIREEYNTRKGLQ